MDKSDSQQQGETRADAAPDDVGRQATAGTSCQAATSPGAETAPAAGAPEPTGGTSIRGTAGDGGAPARWAGDAALVGVAAIAFGVLIANAAVKAWPGLSATGRFWLGMLPLHGVGFGGVLVTVCTCCARGAGMAALELAPARLAPWTVLRQSAKTLAVVYPLTVVLTVLVAAVMLALNLPVRGSPVGLLLQAGEGWPLWLSMVLGTLVLAPLAEEVLFRLVLFDAIRPHVPARAAILTSMVFAAVHQSPEATPALFLLGMVLQRARQRSGALWLPVTVHAGFNAISLVLYAALQGLGWGT